MARFDRQTVSALAEKLGERKLLPETEEFLCDYLEYRIREIVELASKFMRHSHRHNLQVKDVRRAMKQMSLEVTPTQTLYGYPSSSPLVYKQCERSDEWVIEDPVVSLEDFLAKTVVTPPLDVTLHSHWLAIMGQRPDIPENHTGVPADTSSQQLSSSDPKVITSVTHQLSSEQQLFYNAFLTCLSDGKHFTGFMESLSSDSSLSQLLPYLIRSFYTMVMETNELEKLSRAVDLIGALSSNPYLNAEAYLHQVMPALLSALLRSGIPDDKHWSYRRKCAHILAAVVNRYMEVFEDLKQKTLEFLSATALDISRQADTCYGALYGIIAFGHAAVSCVLLPNLDFFLSSEGEVKIHREDPIQATYLKSALLVRGMQDAARTVAWKPELRAQLEEIFGDQLISLTDVGSS